MMSVAAPIDAQSVTTGIEAWQRSDYTKAVAIWMPLATKGDPDAQFNLGQAYRLGKGVPTNIGAAKTWFERAAGQGHVDAQTTLGLLLFQNGDQVGGLEWLKKAADQGEARAMLVYGTALVNGDGVPQDPILGYALVSGAARQGLAPAKQTLDQLDQLLPAADRKRALAMALDRPRPAAASPATAAEHAAKPAIASPKPSSKLAKEAAEKEVASSTEPEPAPKPVEVANAQSPPEAASQAAPRPEEVASVNTALQQVRKPDSKPAHHAATEKKLAEAKPDKKPAEAKATPPVTGEWRIQLGSFAQKSNAETLVKKLFRKEALDGRTFYYVPAGGVTRLQVGPFESKSAASSACKAVGVACFAINAK
jgi:hypothetical protein